jgi:hypothetical protein
MSPIVNSSAVNTGSTGNGDERNGDGVCGHGTLWRTKTAIDTGALWLWPATASPGDLTFRQAELSITP